MVASVFNAHSFLGAIKGALVISAIATIPLGLIVGWHLLFSRLDVKDVYCGPVLLINGERVEPAEVVSLRSIDHLHRRLFDRFVEIHYRTSEGVRRVIAASKPVWFWQFNDRTLDIIVEQFPELKDRVVGEYLATRMRELRDPSKRKPDSPSFEPHAPSPTARYRDPYFQRRPR